MAKRQVVITVDFGGKHDIFCGAVQEASSEEVRGTLAGYLELFSAGAMVGLTTHSGHDVLIPTRRIISVSVMNLDLAPKPDIHQDSKFDVGVREGHSPLAEDEPVFAFRAQDKFMPDVLAFYAEKCAAGGSPEDHVSTVAIHREEALAWQARNGCRVPD
jgi:hypothetical protein